MGGATVKNQTGLRDSIFVCAYSVIFVYLKITLS